MTPSNLLHALVRLVVAGGVATVLFACEHSPAPPSSALAVSASSTLTVPQGCPVTLPVYLSRPAGVTGDVQVQLSGLPDGVTSPGTTLGTGDTGGAVVVRAAPDTPVTTAAVTLTATLGTRSITKTLSLTTLAAASVCPELAEHAKVLDTDAVAGLSTYDPDGTLTFKAATPVVASLNAGDVLLGTAGPAAPYGFLRKVTAVKTVAGRRVVSTVPAYLEDAYRQLSLEVKDYPVVPVTPSAQGLRKQGLRAQDGWAFSVNHTFGDAPNTLTVNGSLLLNPTIDLGIDIRCCRSVVLPYVQHYHLNLHHIDQIDMGVQVQGGFTLERKVTLYHLPMVPIVLYFLEFNPSIDVDLGVQGQVSVTASFHVHHWLDTYSGATYDDGVGWRDLTRHGEDYRVTDPVFQRGTVTLKAFLDAPASFRLYDVVGPKVSAEAHVQTSVSASLTCPGADWTLSAGLSHSVGFLIRAWSLTLIDYQAPLFNFDREIASAHATCPPPPPTLPSVTITAPAAGTNVSVDLPFNVAVTALRDGHVCCALTWSPAPVSTFGSTATFRFPDSGPHTIAVTATDTDGVSSHAEVTVNATDDPPTVHLTFPEAGAVVAPGASLRLQGSATDANEPDGTLLCPSLTWSSDLDGVLGTGCVLDVSFATPGLRQVQLQATDPQGMQASATVRVTVQATTNHPPVPVIMAPGPSGVIDGSQALLLQGQASDPDGDAVSRYAWQATAIDDAGQITGGPVIVAGTATATWTPGASLHLLQVILCQRGRGQQVRLDFTATDALGATGSASETLHITCPPS